MFINKTKDGKNNLCGPRVTVLRKERKWSQRMLADKLQLAGLDLDKNAIQRIEAGHDPDNPASGAVQRKCGLKYEGTFRRRIRSNRGITDVAWYGILREER